MLKFLKIVITFLSFAEQPKDLASLILTHVFSLKNSAKYTMIIRRILNKLIARVGLQIVLQCTAKEHHALINYIERARRKVKNAKQREQFALSQKSGKTGLAGDDPAAVDSDNEDFDSDLDDGDEAVVPSGRQ